MDPDQHESGRRGQTLRGAPCPTRPCCSRCMPVIRHRLTSRLLAGNPLGDPVERDLYVYVPPGYDADAARRWPAVLALVGYTGTCGTLFNVVAVIDPLHDRLSRMIARGAGPTM